MKQLKERLKERRERQIKRWHSRPKECVKFTLCLFLCTLFLLPLQLQAKTTTKINILATSDMHNMFYPYDYALDEPYNQGGLARIATAIAANSTANTVLIDNGDTLQGVASMLNLQDEVSPMMMGMNALGYDVWNSGNHEYNYGVPFLERAIQSFQGQFLAANVYDANGMRLAGAKNYTVIERSGIRIAVIGVVTPHIVRWDKANLQTYHITDPQKEVEDAVAEIQAQDLADITLVAFHASVRGEGGTMTDAAEKIATEVPFIDAVIAGHEHALIAKTVAGKTNPVPIVEPGRFGEYISEITFEVSLQDGTYQIVDYDQDVTYRNIKTADYENDTAMLQLLLPFHERALRDTRTVIGTLLDGPLVPQPDIQGITQAQIEDTPLIDLILKVQLAVVEASGAIPQGARHVSGTALFTEEANIQKGAITKADVANIYRFDNMLMTLKIDGAGLKRYLEWSAGYYNQFSAGDLTISYRPQVRIYNYDMFAGIKYQIDVSAANGKRIRKLTYLDDVAVADSDEIYLTVNNYRANTHLRGQLVREDVPVVYDSANEVISTVRELIVDYLSRIKTIRPEVDDNWQLIGHTWERELHDVVRALVHRGDIIIPRSEDGRTPNIRSMREADILRAANVIDLLTLNDFHGAVSETGSNIGAAKLGGVIKQKQQNNPQTIFLGGGDLFQGSALSNLTRGAVVSALLQEYGMAYSAIGNHEFDWGIETLRTLGENGHFQFLAANIIEKDGKDRRAQQEQYPDWLQPYAIFEIGGKKIGFIGLSTPTTAQQTAPENVKNLVFLDPITTAKKWERYLRREAGVDLVIALTHLGAAQVGDTITGEAVQLARAIPTLDGVFSAHTHQFVQGDVAGVPVVQGGHNGRGLANIRFIYTKDGEKLAVIPTKQVFAEQEDVFVEDEKSQRIVDEYQEALAPILEEVVAVNEQELPHDTDAGTGITPLGQATTKMMRELGDADVGLINGGGIRLGLHKGPITVGDLYTLIPFDNTFVTFDITGADLKKAIEHGIIPETFRSGQFYGLRVWYTIDALGKPRVTSMRLLNGEKIVDTRSYRIATVDFLLAGGDAYDFPSAKNIIDTHIPLREKMKEALQVRGRLRHEFFETLFFGTDSTDTDQEQQEKIETHTSDRLIRTGTSTHALLGIWIIWGSICSYYGARKTKD